MRNNNQINMGSVHVHKMVLADIVSTVISGVDGVELYSGGFGESLLELFGQGVPGVCVTIDDNNDVSLNVKVRVRYGMNIPDVARHIQEEIRLSLDKTVDINLKDVNVSIQRIERGEK